MNVKRVQSVLTKLRFMCIIDGCKRAKFMKRKHILRSMGDNCLFQSRVFPMDPKLVKIHNNVTVAANVTFCTHDAIRHVLCGYDDHKYVPHYGPIEVEDNVFIGIGTIIMPNVHIGANSIIAAGSLVLKDVPSGSIVGGRPAKIIGSFEDLHQKRIDEGVKYGKCSDKELVNLAWTNFYNDRK